MRPRSVGGALGVYPLTHLPCQLIPVLDLMGGQVVAAQGGQRHSYQPLVSPLCPDSQPQSALKSFAQQGFGGVYIADLDAILKRGNHFQQLGLWLENFPAMEFWLDGGFTDFASVEQARQMILHNSPAAEKCVRWVLGSETFTETATLAERGWPTDCILSLDFGAEGFRGDWRLLQDALWPSTVIVMTLAQVGAGKGPDYELLAQLAARARSKHLVAAGGVGQRQDLIKLQQLGIKQALVATALHRGQLP